MQFVRARSCLMPVREDVQRREQSSRHCSVSLTANALRCITAYAYAQDCYDGCLQHLCMAAKVNRL